MIKYTYMSKYIYIYVNINALQHLYFLHSITYTAGMCVNSRPCLWIHVHRRYVSFGVPEGNRMRISRALARLVGE